MTVLAALVCLAVGFAIGVRATGRHIDHQCEVAYVTGHCDGYTKAMHDYQEVPL